MVREFVSESTWYDTAAGPLTTQAAMDTKLGRLVVSAASRANLECKSAGRLPG